MLHNFKENILKISNNFIGSSDVGDNYEYHQYIENEYLEAFNYEYEQFEESGPYGLLFTDFDDVKIRVVLEYQ